MANNIIRRKWNQNTMVSIEDLSGSAFQAESGGHTFEISGVDNYGNTVALSGTVAGVFMRSDNTDVAITGTASGGIVTITLPAECYDVPGRFGLTIFVTADSKKTAIYAAIGTVRRTSSGNVAPGTTADVVDLINQIQAAVATIPQSWTGLMADIAPTYSDSALYGIGQYAWYDGDLKRCIVPITTAESYNAAHWTSAVLGQDVSDLKSAITTVGVTETLFDISQYTVINGGMQSNNTWAGTNGLYQSALITDIPALFAIIPPEGKSGYVSFFDKVPEQPHSASAQIFFCVGETGRHEAPSGAKTTYTVPNDCKCIVVTTKANGSARNNTLSGWFLTGEVVKLSERIDATNADIDTLENSVELINGKTILKANATQAPNEVILEGYIYTKNNLVIGTTKLSDVSKVASSGAKAIKIPMDGIVHISYPLFKTTINGISFFCDSADTVIWAYSETEADTGTQKIVKVPQGASYFVLMVSNGLNALDWYYIISSLKVMEEPEQLESFESTPFANENRNMCLAGIKTDILTDKIPYHRGFLFHKLQNNDNSLWYGENFNDIHKIGTVSFNPTLMRFAISPKDGRIIAVQRDTRNGIWVWDGETETHLNSFTTNPMAWLYNSGVDFINSGTDEYCIFAEYNGGPVTGTVFNVWRGKYPYTSASDWSIVKTEEYSNINHFHQVRRDPWSDVLYLTSGDNHGQNKWWYSTDYGATWTLLVNGSESGWSNSICRTINFVFTADYIYWATDHGQNEHGLYRIQRDENTGIIDLSTREKVTDLPGLRATNSLCYVESPNGLFMYDRVDTAPETEFGNPITMKFWSFDTETLVDVVTLGLTQTTWGGSRGKCYVNYTNGVQPYPAMGFSIDTPCIFDLVCDDPENIGTIAYDVGAKTIRTANY